MIARIVFLGIIYFFAGFFIPTFKDLGSRWTMVALALGVIVSATFLGIVADGVLNRR